MKNKIFTVILLTSTVLSLASCASRKYGCPSTVKVENKSAEKNKV
jgi:hypothetical protein